MRVLITPLLSEPYLAHRVRSVHTSLEHFPHFMNQPCRPADRAALSITFPHQRETSRKSTIAEAEVDRKVKLEENMYGTYVTSMGG